MAKEINLLCKSIRDREFCFLNDQIRRAMSSIVLNIAEGSGKYGRRDKMNFYRIARASAFECVGAIDLFIAYQLANEQQVEKHKKRFEEIAGDLQAMIFSLERKRQ